MKNINYKARLVDEKIDKILTTAGAISIVGPKWCGKSWTAKYHGNSLFEMDNPENVKLAKVDLGLILNGERPSIIDEWDRVPEIWDTVRHICDEDNKKGKFILTCSASLDEESQKKIFHSGAGRIINIKMNTMSLFESGDSTGDISIMEMYKGINISKNTTKKSIDEICQLIVRGGFPGNLDVKNYNILPKSYINSILERDIRIKKKFNKTKMLMILKSLARNESSLATDKTIISDAFEYADNDEFNICKNTAVDYMEILEQLYLVENQIAYSPKLRSKNRIGKSVKRHLADVSLVAALLGINEYTLGKDVETLGFLFESMVERDLRIYMSYLDGNLYHFHDNTSGLEIDSILEFNDGEYAACEIKLGILEIEEAKKNLLKYYNAVKKKPKFMCIIVGTSSAIYREKDTGIYILPITALKP